MQNIVGRYVLKSHGTFDQDKNFKKTSEFLKGELTYASDSSLSVIIENKLKLSVDLGEGSRFEAIWEKV